MRLFPTATIALLALTTAGALVFGVQQYRRAEGLAAAAAEQHEERTQLQSEVQKAQARARAAEERVATVPLGPSEPVPAGDGDPAPAERGRPGQLRMNELMENPEFAAAWQAQQKARLDGPYAALFRKLNLTPAQIERFKTLLAERQAARMDVMTAARDQGFSGRESRDELRQLMLQAQAEVDAGIREVLGEAGYQQYQQYERTAPQRGLVSQLETRLSYSGAPLTSAQSEALVTILSETSARGSPVIDQRIIGGAGTMPVAIGGGSIPDAAITRAQSVLSPAQVEALRQLQNDQQAQRQVSEMMREHFRNGRPTRVPAPGSDG